MRSSITQEKLDSLSELSLILRNNKRLKTTLLTNLPKDQEKQSLLWFTHETRFWYFTINV